MSTDGGDDEQEGKTGEVEILYHEESEGKPDHRVITDLVQYWANCPPYNTVSAQVIHRRYVKRQAGSIGGKLLVQEKTVLVIEMTAAQAIRHAIELHDAWVHVAREQGQETEQATGTLGQ